MKKIIATVIAVAALSACAGIGGHQEKQFALEKRACAELGLDPASSAGNQCALDLDASLFEIDTAR
jgi:hypothetical protein